MKILVTGAEGFIGSKLCLNLKAAKFEVIEHKLKDGDLSDPNCLNYLHNTEIDHIVHLAALNFVPDSWTKTAQYFQANILSVVNVLELCKLKNASLTFISSYLYGVPNTLPISEKHSLQMVNPYMLSKNIGEQVCDFYFKNFNVSCSVIRPFNIYGIGQNENFLIPKIISSSIQYGSVEVFDLRPKRDYLYVDDFLELIVSSLHIEGGFNIYNAGSGNSYSVLEIITKVKDILGKNIEYKSLKTERKNEIPNVIADIQKARADFGWYPKVSIDNGLKYIIDSYLNS